MKELVSRTSDGTFDLREDPSGWKNQSVRALAEIVAPWSSIVFNRFRFNSDEVL
jgi:hypothetical protein